ncbi:MAG TPA: hypothetical protein VHQ24_13235 [Lachnospiraceae bacterium]|nr:hypothetical protein [Lachnospiraceae bacterium]
MNIAGYGQTNFDYYVQQRDTRKGNMESEKKSPSNRFEDSISDIRKKKSDSASDTDSNIVVKPDGSKVLVVTTKVGGMETTMSIKLSEPTLFPGRESTASKCEDTLMEDEDMEKGSN